MAQFPIPQAEVLALGQAVLTGLQGNAVIYPDPPVDLVDFAASLEAYVSAGNEVIAARAALSRAVAAKQRAFEDFVGDIKRQLRYAENTTGGNDAQLKLLGWGARRHRAKASLPGQVRTLEAGRQGPDWIFLDWKAPIEGGKLAAFVVQRRKLPDGDWTEAATAIASEITLKNQPRGIELEYRIVAINKAGQGRPSNTVMAVL